jgi:hypothetical protein
MVPPLVGKLGSTGPTVSLGCTVMARSRTSTSPFSAKAGVAATAAAMAVRARRVERMLFSPLGVELG